MQADYKDCIDRIIHRYEGGYGWNKKDPGGPTNFGVTCYDLAENRGQKVASMNAWAPLVRDMTLDEAELIYKTKYARGIRFDDLPAGIDVVMLDYGINSGNSRAIRVARTLVGQPAGGTMDQALLDDLKKVDPIRFINVMCDERLRFMHAIRKGSAWKEFGHGWQARVDDLRQYSTAVAKKTSGADGRPSAAAPAPDLSKIATPKATNVGAAAPKTAMISTSAVGLAVHFSDFNWWYAAGAGAVVLGGFIAFEAWQDIKAKQANDLVHV